MCDTIVALGNATADGSVIFAKNSDRAPNESHYLEMVEGQRFEADAILKCTYIEIPQVKRTHKVLLAKPFWIWGAEMGANEHGVVIGNEAVFTKVPGNQTPSLIGMDLLRLGLERGSTAEEAMHVIVALLEEFGQGGNCGFGHPLFYDNSFIIADTHEAWVLETAGKFWAAEKVKDIRSISNVITIDKKWDLASDNLVEYAIEKGWCKQRNDFSFTRCYSDFLYTTFGAGHERLACTTKELADNKGQISVLSMMKLLRTHSSAVSPKWSPDSAITGADVCMHSGFGPIRISQTTGSMISHIHSDITTHWLTATSAPCTSVFKPIWFDSGLPEHGPIPEGKYDSSSYWWQHELLHRTTLLDYPSKISRYQKDRDVLQEEFIKAAYQGVRGNAKQRAEISDDCFKRAMEAEKSWTERIRNPMQNKTSWYYHMAWQSINRKAGITL